MFANSTDVWPIFSHFSSMELKHIADDIFHCALFITYFAFLTLMLKTEAKHTEKMEKSLAFD
jgi:hypothetical protein